MFGYSSQMDWSQFNALEKQYIESLPHGSGIDASWDCIKLGNGKVECRNSYHCMDENGFYCGWQDFTVRFEACNPQDTMRLMFNGRHYLADKYMLRDYLEETIAYGFDTVKL